MIDLSTLSAENIEQLRYAVTKIRSTKSIGRLELEDVMSLIKFSVNRSVSREITDLQETCRLIRKRGIPTPTLAVCGRGTQEIRYTKLLGYYLDPANPHGLNDFFTKALLPKDILRKLPPDWSSRVHVETEYTLRSGNSASIADIAVIGTTFLIIIEQKITSSESSYSEEGEDKPIRQLDKYDLSLRDYQGRQVYKIFLTPTARPSSGNGWINLTHLDVLTTGTKLLYGSALCSVGARNLQLLLLDLAFGPLNTTLEEIERVCELVLSNPPTATTFNLYKRIVGMSPSMLTVLKILSWREENEL